MPKSVNRQFLVKNTHDQKIKTRIFLAGGVKSTFRLNVDGDTGTFFDEVEIRANDSIFVFVEAYPLKSFTDNPIFIKDSIVFITNGNMQDVKLITWGQDAVYFYRDSTETDLVWADKNKPYVIYDYFYVKPGATLRILPGVKVYFAPYSTLYTEGTLKVEGTLEEPVIFEGDRTADKYSDAFTIYKYYNIPGQWFGLAFGWPSNQNSIRHARIKNATVGIFLDSSSSDGQPNVGIYNCIIQNMLYNAVRGNQSMIYSENSVFANCGSACIYTFKGGDYDLKHITISGYTDFSGSSDPALAVTNRLRNDFGQILATYPLKFSLLNSIVHGPKEEEFYTDIDDTKVLAFSPLNNLIKTKNKSFGQTGTRNILNVDPKFVDYKKYRFDLDTLSPAKDTCLNIGINTDLNNINRDSKPDAGAYERKE